MRYLFGQWEQAKRKLSERRVFLFFDYDGTLAPIARTPRQAAISRKVKKLLKRLSRKPNLALAIISGRALKDIKRIVGVKGIIYAGNHGLEIKGPRIKFKARINPVIRGIYKGIVKKLASVKGVLIEDKGLAVSVHYRLINAKGARRFLSRFLRITRPFTAGNKIKIQKGKKVYEIRPPVDWDKGKAVLWLLARQKSLSGEKILPVYFGDDLTDEDAFKALKNKGLTVFVGRPRVSEAVNYLRNTEEVTRFMELFLN